MIISIKTLAKQWAFELVQYEDSTYNHYTGSWQHRGCIMPQAVTHSPVLLKMGKIISRNMLS